MIRHLALLLLAAGLPAAVAVPELLGDHLVLQQQAEVPLWGWGTRPGETITVTASWGESVETKVGPDARWRVVLHTPAATPLKEGLKPYHIEITAPKENQIQLRDVLVGEVWLCSGQSNMVMPCGPGHPKGWCAWDTEADWATDRPLADRPALRLYNVQERVAAAPLDDTKGVIPGVTLPPPGPDGIIPRPARGWQRCTPDIADGFSAVAYHLGVTLQEQLGVPVGLIVSAYGGTSISPWTSLEGHRDAAGKVPTGEAAVGRPGSLFNGMIAPLMPFRLAGVAWYQGESNVGATADEYARLLRLLIADWRRANGNSDLPFYYVQLAAIARNGDAVGNLRDAQAQVQDDPHVGMAVITDLSVPTNIHPKFKKGVGQRLARLALARTYGRTDVAADAPRATTATATAEGIRIAFTHADGLRTRDGKLPGGFEVAGADGVFQPATATLDGTTVLVACPAVAKPATVRFAWGGGFMTTLVAASGLPPGQFRLPIAP